MVVHTVHSGVGEIMSGQAPVTPPVVAVARQTTIGYFVRETYQEECLRFVEELKRRLEAARSAPGRE